MTLRTLLIIVVGGSLIVCVGRPSIITVYRLPYGRSALHHINRLPRHCLRAVGRSHDGLRSHGMGAAGHGWIGTENVGKGGVPCSRRLPILRRSRIFSALLVAVVCHESVSIMSLLRCF